MINGEEIDKKQSKKIDKKFKEMSQLVSEELKNPPSDSKKTNKKQIQLYKENYQLMRPLIIESFKQDFVKGREKNE